MFVLAGTMFIVPAITEKALALTSGNAYLDIEGKFYNVRGHLSAGVFLRPFGYPRILPGGDIITWATGGTGIYGNEGGYVSAHVVGLSPEVFFHFSNPAKGRNTCAGVPPSIVTCTITQGIHATATYHVRPSALLPDANGRDANTGDEGDDSGDTS
jgi:hypothetical protein